MRIGVPNETRGERRVAIIPQVALRLVERRHQVVIESGAGLGAAISDDDYRSAGVEVSADPFRDADVVLMVGPPGRDQVERVPEERF